MAPVHADSEYIGVSKNQDALHTIRFLERELAIPKAE
jgi:hypothetical protein